jgi:DNA-binding Lrp family transcriptional regulator
MDSRELAKKIAYALEDDCRLTPAEIAAAVESDEPTVRAAVEDMERSGVIVRYAAKVDWQKLDEAEKVYAIIEVSMTPERDFGFDKMASRIARFSEVHSLYLLSGDYDFEVVLEGRSMRDIALFVAERLAPLPGVRSTCTHFVLRSYKRDGDILIGEQGDRRLAVSP